MRRAGHRELVRFPTIERQLIPSRLRCSFSTVLFGSIPIASASPFYFDVCGNSIYTPWATGGTSFTGAGGVLRGGTGAVAGILPEGYSNIFGANKLYQNFRVYSSSIAVKMLNENVADSGWLTIVPYVVGSTVNNTIFTASQAPHSKGPVQVDPGNPNSGSLRHSMTTHKIYGVTRQAVQDDNLFVGSYNSAPSNTWFWRVLYNDVTDAATGAAFGVKVYLRFNVECFNGVIGGLPET